MTTPKPPIPVVLEYRVLSPGGQLLDTHRTEHEIEPPDTPDPFEITFEVGIRGQPKRQCRAAIPADVAPGATVVITQDLHLTSTHVEETQVLRDEDGRMVGTRRSTVPTTVKWGDS